MSKCLILYSTTDGHTKKICDRIAYILNKNNNTAITLNLAKFDQTKLNDCDSIITVSYTHLPSPRD